MSVQQETFRSSVASAEQSKLNSLASAVITHQVTVDASNSVVGYRAETGNYTNLAAAVKSANAAKLQAFQDAEVAKQKAITSARETFRAATGEIY